jgi:hypothetical protein
MATDVQYGTIADTTDTDPTYHIAVTMPANYPFHPTSNCGQTLNRALVDEVPKGAPVCNSCKGTKAEAKTDA